MSISAVLLLFAIFSLLFRIAVVWIAFHFTEKMHKLWPLVAAVVFFLISAVGHDFVAIDRFPRSPDQRRIHLVHLIPHQRALAVADALVLSENTSSDANPCFPVGRV